jgi:hypothetical protein
MRDTNYSPLIHDPRDPRGSWASLLVTVSLHWLRELTAALKDSTYTLPSRRVA